MRPLSVVVPDVDAEDVLELAATEDDQPVEALAADGRLTDLWHVWNTLMLARQLGAPAPDLSISPQA